MPPTTTEYIAFTGSSMEPTLRAGDGVLIVPTRPEEVRLGDLVMFPRPDDTEYIVHRVIKRMRDGVRTRGDNEFYADPFVVPYERILGRVACYQRGSVKTEFPRGRPRFILVWQVKRLLRLNVNWGVRALCRRLARMGIFHGWHKPFVRTRFLEFPSANGSEFLLLFGKRAVARLMPGTDAWIVRFPFDLFVDARELPRRLATPASSPRQNPTVTRVGETGCTLAGYLRPHDISEKDNHCGPDDQQE